MEVRTGGIRTCHCSVGKARSETRDVVESWRRERDGNGIGSTFTAYFVGPLECMYTGAVLLVKSDISRVSGTRLQKHEEFVEFGNYLTVTICQSQTSLASSGPLLS